MGKTDPHRAFLCATVATLVAAGAATAAELTTYLSVSAVVANICEVETKGAEARVTCEMSEEATLSVTGGDSVRMRLQGDRPARFLLPPKTGDGAAVLVIAY